MKIQIRERPCNRQKPAPGAPWDLNGNVAAAVYCGNKAGHVIIGGRFQSMLKGSAILEKATGKDGTQSNHSAGKLLMIIECLADKSEPVRLMDISKELKMNSSTVLRFLTALVDNGYAKQEPETARYSLTYKIYTLGSKVSSHIGIKDVARPYMTELSMLFGEVVCLAVEQDREVIYIDIVQSSTKMLRSMQRIGHIAPLHCTAIGKLLLLNYTDEQLDHVIADKGLTKFTESTITTKEQLVEELQSIRWNGYAYDDEECEIGARCIAFPLYDVEGKVIAGVSVTGPTARMSIKQIQLKLQPALQIIGRLRKELGYTG